MRFKAILVALTVAVAIPAVSQVVPSATQGGLPLKVGGGFSDFTSMLGRSECSAGRFGSTAPPWAPEISQRVWGRGRG